MRFPFPAILLLLPLWIGCACAEETRPEGVSHVPVLVLADDGTSRWLSVEVPIQQVPEPSALLLTATAAGLLLRRRR